MSSQLDLIFHSLSDETRRNIVRRLVQQELSVSEIAKPYDMSLAAVSKHVKVLEKAGLIHRRKEGKHYFLQTDVEPLKKVEDWMNFYRKFWQDAFDHLDQLLAEMKQEESYNERTTETE